MNRLPLIGAVAAGLMAAVLTPAVANASTHAMGAGPHVHTVGAAGHMRAAAGSARVHATGTTGHDHAASAAPGTPKPIPIGTPISLTVIGAALQFFPTILGDGVQR